MTHHRSTTRLLLAGTAAALLLAGCGGDDAESDATTTTTTTTEATTSSASTGETSTSSSEASSSTEGGTTAPPATDTTAPGSEGCTTGDIAVPAGAVTREVVDVDGDGQPDTAWVGQQDGAFRFGITYAAGGSADTVIDSVAPSARIALVADVDGAGPVEALAGTLRSVGLFAFVDCGIAPVTNPQGDTYQFLLGTPGAGTGVGCVDTDAGRRLVGLDVAESDETTVSWTRTVVELDGTGARNGETAEGTFTAPEDDARIDTLYEVTCGDLTVESDGIRFEP